MMLIYVWHETLLDAFTRHAGLQAVASDNRQQVKRIFGAK